MRVAGRFGERSLERTKLTLAGLDRRRKAGSGGFADMKNMSGDERGCISSRKARGAIELSGGDVFSMVTTDVMIEGEIVENAFIVDSDNRLRAFYMKDGEMKEYVLMNTTNFTSGENTMICSGGYLYFFPDKKYINLMNTEDKGSLEAHQTLKGGVVNENGKDHYWEVHFTPCDINGDTSNDTGCFLCENKQYEYKNSAKGALLGSPAIGHRFEVGDVVHITGAGFDSYHRIVHISTNETHIVFEGYANCVVDSESMSISREVPDMDYVIASKNRLWGCRYGVDTDGRPINEIYASALGDAKNWYIFEGTALDSYAASVGADGVFTGAVEYSGTPVFFKEDAVIRVYGDYPANYNVYTSNIRGIEKGSALSACVVNEGLYYKSHSGFVCYNGGIPLNIDDALGDAVYRNAVCGCLGNKYYVSAETEKGCELLVYDTSDYTWHKEDNRRITCYSRCGNELYMLTDGMQIYSVNSKGNAAGEDKVEWMCETAEFCCDDAGRRYVSSIEAGMELEEGSLASVEIEYDGGGKWMKLASVRGRGKRSYMRVRPRRCASFALRFSGEGEFTLSFVRATVSPCGIMKG